MSDANTMDSCETCSNTRLCTVFEMLVGRLDTLGDQITAVQAEQVLQRRRLCHADSLLPLGTRFSGVNFCGKEVVLTLHTPINTDGGFSRHPDLIFIDLLGGMFTSALYGPEIDAFRAQILHKHPSIRCWGTDGILAVCSDLKEAHQLILAVADDLGPYSDDLEIHAIPERLGPLAMALVDVKQQHVKAAWANLDSYSRESLSEGDHSFFTKSRLQRLMEQ